MKHFWKSYYKHHRDRFTFYFSFMFAWLIVVTIFTGGGIVEGLFAILGYIIMSPFSFAVFNYPSCNYDIFKD